MVIGATIALVPPGDGLNWSTPSGHVQMSSLAPTSPLDTLLTSTIQPPNLISPPASPHTLGCSILPAQLPSQEDWRRYPFRVIGLSKPRPKLPQPLHFGCLNISERIGSIDRPPAITLKEQHLGERASSSRPASAHLLSYVKRVRPSRSLVSAGAEREKLSDAEWAIPFSSSAGCRGDER